jgi:hypothetical protein
MHICHQTNHNTMKKTGLIYGVLAGASAAIFFLVPVSFYDPASDGNFMMKYGELFGYGAQLLSMLFVLFGVRALSKQSATHFSFLRGLGSGLGITLIATAIFYLGNVLLYEVINPNFLSDFMEAYEPKLLEAASTPEERAAVEQQMKEWAPLVANGWLYAGLMCMSVLGFGVLFSLLSAFLFKHKA